MKFFKIKSWRETHKIKITFSQGGWENISKDVGFSCIVLAGWVINWATLVPWGAGVRRQFDQELIHIPYDSRISSV